MADGPIRDGFVRVHHPKLEGTADVPSDSLDHHRSLGWEPVDDEATPEPEPEPELAEEDQL